MDLFLAAQWVGLDSLGRMKPLAGRLQDRADLERLGLGQEPQS